MGNRHSSASSRHNHRVKDKHRKQSSEAYFEGGRYEYEVLGPGLEAEESAKAWGECTKNPGHRNFIPYGEYAIKWLPGKLQSMRHANRISDVAARTVRIRVNYTSLTRPDYDQASAGHRVGTGIVVGSVAKSNMACTCLACHGRPAGEKRTTWVFTVHTASHVVFDSDEAQMTYVDLFYDYDAARHDGRMKTLHGLRVVHRDSSTDQCVFTCVTHDRETIASYHRIVDHPIFRTDKDEYDFPMRRSPSTTYAEMSAHAIIISHPHGQSKKLTLGFFEGTVPVRDTHNIEKGTPMKYSTDTCPGSSGAPVLLFNTYILNMDLSSWNMYHSQTSTKGDMNIGIAPSQLINLKVI